MRVDPEPARELAAGGKVRGWAAVVLAGGVKSSVESALRGISSASARRSSGGKGGSSPKSTGGPTGRPARFRPA